jgi:hypothetical protein
MNKRLSKTFKRAAALPTDYAPTLFEQRSNSMRTRFAVNQPLHGQNTTSD